MVRLVLFLLSLGMLEVVTGLVAYLFLSPVVSPAVITALAAVVGALVLNGVVAIVRRTPSTCPKCAEAGR